MSPQSLDVDRIPRETFVRQVQHYLSLGSTNDCAKTLTELQLGDLPLLIVADQQTAGRGRATNRWWTGRGSLAFSLLFEPHVLGMARTQWPLIALAAGVAVVEAVAPRLPNSTVGLHWPNDVYADGRKLAGILVEGRSDGRCIVGIGLNANNSLREAPRELQQSATTLLELTGHAHDPTELLVRVLVGLETLLTQLAASPEAVARRADACCLQHGRVLSLQQGTRSTTGRCAGIALDGSLLLETATGLQKVYSGTLR